MAGLTKIAYSLRLCRHLLDLGRVFVVRRGLRVDGPEATLGDAGTGVVGLVADAGVDAGGGGVSHMVLLLRRCH